MRYFEGENSHYTDFSFCGSDDKPKKLTKRKIQGIFWCFVNKRF